MADTAENTPLDAAAAVSLGKRHLLVRDYNSAVPNFIKACELLEKEHGEGADELAEPYLLYGRALLGLAREESNVLGSGVPGTKDSDEEDIDDDEEGEEEEKDDKSEKDSNEEKDDVAETEEKKDVAEKEDKKETAEQEDKKDTAEKEEKKDVAEQEKKDVEKADDSSKETDASSEKKDAETSQSGGENKTEEQKVEELKKEAEKASDESTPIEESKKAEVTNITEAKEDTTSSTDQEKNEKSKVQKDDAVPGSSKMMNGESSSALNGSMTENGEEEDDVDNLEVAWEVLELAKLMLLKRGQAGWKMLAEAHKLLGEVAMEGGNAGGAVTDFQACLDLLQKMEPCEPRAIAEIFYQLGLCFSFANDFDMSIEKFQEASSILEARIKELEQITEPPKCDDPFYSIEGEIKELKELLPEIAEKITDMKDAKQEACKRLIENIRERAAAGSCSNGASTSTVNGGASSSGTSSGPSGSSSGSSGSSSGLSKKSVNDISHLIRKKRKPEEALVEESSPCKKVSPQ